jgi:hypothetical protein
LYIIVSSCPFKAVIENFHLVKMQESLSTSISKFAGGVPDFLLGEVGMAGKSEFTGG